jgi:hypothetical protein
MPAFGKSGKLVKSASISERFSSLAGINIPLAGSELEMVGLAAIRPGSFELQDVDAKEIMRKKRTQRALTASKRKFDQNHKAL